MPARKRVRTRARTIARARRDRGARSASRGRSAARDLREVLDAQAESGDELRKAKVPVVTEPAFLFRV